MKGANKIILLAPCERSLAALVTEVAQHITMGSRLCYPSAGWNARRAIFEISYVPPLAAEERKGGSRPAPTRSN